MVEQSNEMQEIKLAIRNLEEAVARTNEGPVLRKYWYTLKEACAVKGVNYKTVCNHHELQPNGGVEDGIIASIRRWTWQTVLAWLELTEKELRS